MEEKIIKEIFDRYFSNVETKAFGDKLPCTANEEGFIKALTALFNTEKEKLLAEVWENIPKDGTIHGEKVIILHHLKQIFLNFGMKEGT